MSKIEVGTNISGRSELDLLAATALQARMRTSRFGLRALSFGRLSAGRDDLRLPVLAVVPVIAMLGLVVFADRSGSVDNYMLLRDPNAIANQPNYYGLISNIGVILWLVGSVCALQAFCLRPACNRVHLPGSLVWGGSFAAVMGLDDLLMIHESISTLGVPETIVLLPHLILLLVFCYHAYFSEVVTPWLLLALAVCAFGLSMFVDVLPTHFPGQILLEEGFKISGIALLTVYLASISQIAVSKRQRR